MSTNTTKVPEAVSAKVQLSIGKWELAAEFAVPAGPTRLRQMLPMVQLLADNIVHVAVSEVESQGQKISCKKGCGACCRQLVPIAEVEARQIRDLVQALPEPRRSQVWARFAEARRQLQESGLLERLLHRDEWAEGEGRSIGLSYFQQGIACPFLEEESCSIYPDRPLACREYLVTSPAEHCARPTAETVRPVKMPLKVWTALARMDEVSSVARFIRWVPLILAPEWADTHPQEPPPRPGPELLQVLFEKLTGKELPAARPPGVQPAEGETGAR